jgi:outer membrane protein
MWGENVGFQGYGYTFKNQAYMVELVGLQWDLFKGYDRKFKISQAKIQMNLLQLKKLDVEYQIEFQTNQAYQEWEISIGSM